jgi:capsular polysaccharide transport system permease protein
MEARMSRQEPRRDGKVTLEERILLKARVFEAMAVRDMMMRYGRGNLGFLWVLLEPMILTVGVMMIWSLMKGEREHGVDIIALVLTGYMPLTMWRHLTNGAIYVLRRNSALLYHRYITLFDIFASRMMLEFLGTTAALVMVTGTLIALDLIKPPEDYGLTVLGWLAMACLSFSMALMVCNLTEQSEVWERFIAPFQYLMLPISGCFFMVDWLPTYGQELILWNPTVHCFELFRAGYLGTQFETHYSIWYPFAFSLVLFAMGLRQLDRTAHHLHIE